MSIHNYPTRNSQIQSIPKILMAQKSMRHLGPDKWNAVSDLLKSCSTVYSFKTTMIHQILSQYNKNAICVLANFHQYC